MKSEIINKYETLAQDNSLSISELCKLANVSPSTFSRWRGGSNPRGATLRKLDAALANKN
jgi:transcriptional regulator with XRE-family HTH domain